MITIGSKPSNDPSDAGGEDGIIVPTPRTSWFDRFKSALTAPFRRMARNKIIAFGRENSHEIMFGMMHGQFVSATVYVVAKLGIPDILKDGPKSLSELAELTKTDEQNLERVMRALATIRVFRRNPDGMYELTALGETLCSDAEDSLRDMTIACCEVSFPALPGFLDCVKTGSNPFQEHFGKHVWEYFSENLPLGETFDRAMSRATERHVATIAQTCDLGDAKTIVDIGGGRGALISALLNANPGVHGILYDRPEVAQEAERRLQEAGLSDRCQVVAGSFLESVPEGGDVYFIKHVLHDWDDEHVLKILGNCRRAMSPESRLLIIEMLTEHDEFVRDLLCKWYDFVQMVSVGGRERTAEEFGALLAKSGFRLASVTPTNEVDVLYLEARPV